jgi:hypothetical protein
MVAGTVGTGYVELSGGNLNPPRMGICTDIQSLYHTKYIPLLQVYIEGNPVFGDGAGEGALGNCEAFTAGQISSAADPTVKVCGTGRVHIPSPVLVTRPSRFAELVGCIGISVAQKYRHICVAQECRNICVAQECRNICVVQEYRNFLCKLLHA